MKNLPKVTQQSSEFKGAQNPDSCHPTSTRNSAPYPFATLWLNLLAPGTLQKERVQINLQHAPGHTGSGPSLALSHGSHARPRATSVAQGLPGSQPQGSDLASPCYGEAPALVLGVLVSDDSWFSPCCC